MYRVLSAPITCQVELTSACNNNCVYCYNYWRHSAQRHHDFMDEKTADRTVEELIENNIFHVTLTGGEVFLRRGQLFRMAEKLLTAGISCAVNSNLTLFSHEDAMKLRSLGIDGILTSVCSFERSRHDEISQRNGSFQRTLRGIGIAVEHGISVAVSMVVVKRNVGDVRQTGLFLKELGVNQFFATKASPPLNSRNFQELMVSREELKSVMDDLAFLRDEGMEVGILECYPLCGYKQQSRYSFVAGRRCSAGITTCTIGATGGIRPCSHSDEEYGNIAVGGMKKAWEGMVVCRNGTRLPQACRSCKLLPRCSGGCRVDALYCTGKYDEQDPYADPAGVSLVELAELKMPDIKELQELSVNPCLKIRREKFGILIAEKNRAGTPALVTVGTFALIKQLESTRFTAAEMAKIANLSVRDAEMLCRAMLRDRIFLLVDTTRVAK